MASRDVRRAAHDLVLRLAVVDRYDGKFVGVWMRRDAQHLADDYVFDVSLPLDRVYFVAGHCEPMRELVCADVYIDVFPEP